MQMEQRTPRYSPYKYPEHEKFLRRLFAIEAEKRRLSLNLEERLQTLENRLLSLINKHGQITIENEHHQNSKEA